MSVPFGAKRLELVVDESTYELMFGDCRAVMNIVSKKADQWKSEAAILVIKISLKARSKVSIIIFLFSW